MLSGPPGTGKTLLAKAIAGEADVPFIACSASQFIELFVGLGASRIRGLFKQARENSPCIIFIDEIDAIAKQRGGAVTAGGGNDEREQTLNQLLTEMDGFEDNSGIILIGATNRPDVIDPALLRPGRFDRKVEVGLPSSQGREDILKVHSSNKLLDSSVSLATIAKVTVGCSGADLQNIMNEAAILAARDDRKCINQSDIDGAYEKITIGLAKKPFTSKDAKKLVAYHEAGHALTGCLVGNFDDIGKVTILPRGGTGGITQFVPDSDSIDLGMYTQEYLNNQLIVALGGRAAEEIVFGKDKITTGASSDLQRVTQIATQMVRSYGFSSIGPYRIDDNTSLSTLSKVDGEIQMIVNKSYNTARELIKDNKKLLDTIASELIKRETLDGSDIVALVANYSFTKSE